MTRATRPSAVQDPLREDPLEDISPPRRLAITQAMRHQIPDGAVDKPYVFRLFPEDSAGGKNR